MSDSSGGGAGGLPPDEEEPVGQGPAKRPRHLGSLVKEKPTMWRIDQGPQRLAPAAAAPVASAATARVDDRALFEEEGGGASQAAAAPKPPKTVYAPSHTLRTSSTFEHFRVAIEEDDLHFIMSEWRESDLARFQGLTKTEIGHPLLHAVHCESPLAVAFFLAVGLSPDQRGRFHPRMGDNLSAQTDSTLPVTPRTLLTKLLGSIGRTQALVMIERMLAPGDAAARGAAYLAIARRLHDHVVDYVDENSPECLSRDGRLVGLPRRGNKLHELLGLHDVPSRFAEHAYAPWMVASYSGGCLPLEDVNGRVFWGPGGWLHSPAQAQQPPQTVAAASASVSASAQAAPSADMTEEPAAAAAAVAVEVPEAPPAAAAVAAAEEVDPDDASTVAMSGDEESERGAPDDDNDGAAAATAVLAGPAPPPELQLALLSDYGQADWVEAGLDVDGAAAALPAVANTYYEYPQMDGVSPLMKRTLGVLENDTGFGIKSQAGDDVSAAVEALRDDLVAIAEEWLDASPAKISAAIAAWKASVPPSYAPYQHADADAAAAAGIDASDDNKRYWGWPAFSENGKSLAKLGRSVEDIAALVTAFRALAKELSVQEPNAAGEAVTLTPLDFLQALATPPVSLAYPHSNLLAHVAHRHRYALTALLLQLGFDPSLSGRIVSFLGDTFNHSGEHYDTPLGFVDRMAVALQKPGVTSMMRGLFKAYNGAAASAAQRRAAVAGHPRLHAWLLEALSDFAKAHPGVDAEKPLKAFVARESWKLLQLQRFRAFAGSSGADAGGAAALQPAPFMLEPYVVPPELREPAVAPAARNGSSSRSSSRGRLDSSFTFNEEDSGVSGADRLRQARESSGRGAAAVHEAASGGGDDARSDAWSGADDPDPAGLWTSAAAAAVKRGLSRSRSASRQRPAKRLRSQSAARVASAPPTKLAGSKRKRDASPTAGASASRSSRRSSSDSDSSDSETSDSDVSELYRDTLSSDDDDDGAPVNQDLYAITGKKRGRSRSVARPRRPKDGSEPAKPRRSSGGGGRSSGGGGGRSSGGSRSGGGRASGTKGPATGSRSSALARPRPFVAAVPGAARRRSGGRGGSGGSTGSGPRQPVTPLPPGSEWVRQLAVPAPAPPLLRVAFADPRQGGLSDAVRRAATQYLLGDMPPPLPSGAVMAVPRADGEVLHLFGPTLQQYQQRHARLLEAAQQRWAVELRRRLRGGGVSIVQQGQMAPLPRELQSLLLQRSAFDTSAAAREGTDLAGNASRALMDHAGAASSSSSGGSNAGYGPLVTTGGAGTWHAPAIVPLGGLPLGGPRPSAPANAKSARDLSSLTTRQLIEHHGQLEAQARALRDERAALNTVLQAAVAARRNHTAQLAAAARLAADATDAAAAAAARHARDPSWEHQRRRMEAEIAALAAGFKRMLPARQQGVTAAGRAGQSALPGATFTRQLPAGSRGGWGGPAPGATGGRVTEARQSIGLALPVRSSAAEDRVANSIVAAWAQGQVRGAAAPAPRPRVFAPLPDPPAAPRLAFPAPGEQQPLQLQPRQQQQQPPAQQLHQARPPLLDWDGDAFDTQGTLGGGGGFAAAQDPLLWSQFAQLAAQASVYSQSSVLGFGDGAFAGEDGGAASQALTPSLQASSALTVGGSSASGAGLVITSSADASDDPDDEVAVYLDGVIARAHAQQQALAAAGERLRAAAAAVVAASEARLAQTGKAAQARATFDNIMVAGRLCPVDDGLVYPLLRRACLSPWSPLPGLRLWRPDEAAAEATSTSGVPIRLALLFPTATVLCLPGLYGDFGREVDGVRRVQLTLGGADGGDPVSRRLPDGLLPVGPNQLLPESGLAFEDDPDKPLTFNTLAFDCDAEGEQLELSCFLNAVKAVPAAVVAELGLKLRAGAFKAAKQEKTQLRIASSVSYTLRPPQSSEPGGPQAPEPGAVTVVNALVLHEVLSTSFTEGVEGLQEVASSFRALLHMLLWRNDMKERDENAKAAAEATEAGWHAAFALCVALLSKPAEGSPAAGGAPGEASNFTASADGTGEEGMAVPISSGEGLDVFPDACLLPAIDTGSPSVGKRRPIALPVGLPVFPVLYDEAGVCLRKSRRVAAAAAVAPMAARDAMVDDGEEPADDDGDDDDDAGGEDVLQPMDQNHAALITHLLALRSAIDVAGSWTARTYGTLLYWAGALLRGYAVYCGSEHHASVVDPSRSADAAAAMLRVAQATLLQLGTDYPGAFEVPREAEGLKLDGGSNRGRSGGGFGASQSGSQRLPEPQQPTTRLVDAPLLTSAVSLAQGLEAVRQLKLMEERLKKLPALEGGLVAAAQALGRKHPTWLSAFPTAQQLCLPDEAAVMGVQGAAASGDGAVAVLPPPLPPSTSDFLARPTDPSSFAHMEQKWSCFVLASNVQLWLANEEGAAGLAAPVACNASLCLAPDSGFGGRERPHDTTVARAMASWKAASANSSVSPQTALPVSKIDKTLSTALVACKEAAPPSAAQRASLPARAADAVRSLTNSTLTLAGHMLRYAHCPMSKLVLLLEAPEGRPASVHAGAAATLVAEDALQWEVRARVASFFGCRPALVAPDAVLATLLHARTTAFLRSLALVDEVVADVAAEAASPARRVRKQGDPTQETMHEPSGLALAATQPLYRAVELTAAALGGRDAVAAALGDPAITPPSVALSALFPGAAPSDPDVKAFYAALLSTPADRSASGSGAEPAAVTVASASQLLLPPASVSSLPGWLLLGALHRGGCRELVLSALRALPEVPLTSLIVPPDFGCLSGTGDASEEAAVTEKAALQAVYRWLLGIGATLVRLEPGAPFLRALVSELGTLMTAVCDKESRSATWAHGVAALLALLLVLAPADPVSGRLVDTGLLSGLVGPLKVAARSIGSSDCRANLQARGAATQSLTLVGAVAALAGAPTVVQIASGAFDALVVAPVFTSLRSQLAALVTERELYVRLAAADGDAVAAPAAPGNKPLYIALIESLSTAPGLYKGAVPTVATAASSSSGGAATQLLPAPADVLANLSFLRTQLEASWLHALATAEAAALCLRAMAMLESAVMIHRAGQASSAAGALPALTPPREGALGEAPVVPLETRLTANVFTWLATCVSFFDKRPTLEAAQADDAFFYTSLRAWLYGHLRLLSAAGLALQAVLTHPLAVAHAATRHCLGLGVTDPSFLGRVRVWVKKVTDAAMTATQKTLLDSLQTSAPAATPLLTLVDALVSPSSLLLQLRAAVKAAVLPKVKCLKLPAASAAQAVFQALQPLASERTGNVAIAMEGLVDCAAGGFAPDVLLHGPPPPLPDDASFRAAMTRTLALLWMCAFKTPDKRGLGFVARAFLQQNAPLPVAAEKVAATAVDVALWPVLAVSALGGALARHPSPTTVCMPGLQEGSVNAAAVARNAVAAGRGAAAEPLPLCLLPSPSSDLPAALGPYAASLCTAPFWLAAASGALGGGQASAPPVLHWATRALSVLACDFSALPGVDGKPVPSPWVQAWAGVQHLYAGQVPPSNAEVVAALGAAVARLSPA